jgi:large subunit ribosomal protein L22
MSVVRILTRNSLLSIRSVIASPVSVLNDRQLHTSAIRCTFTRQGEDIDPWPKPTEWPLRNHFVHPPQGPDELRRRAECFHCRANVKYSPKKMWYICEFIKGMTIDEAMKQLSFVSKKGAIIMMEVLDEARELALKEHHFEHRSNMFIGASQCEQGLVIKSARKHAFYRMGTIHHRHTHVLVQLVEGAPPPDYHLYNFTNRQRLDHYLDDLKKRNIKFSL